MDRYKTTVSWFINLLHANSLINIILDVLLLEFVWFITMKSGNCSWVITNIRFNALGFWIRGAYGQQSYISELRNALLGYIYIGLMIVFFVCLQLTVFNKRIFQGTGAGKGKIRNFHFRVKESNVEYFIPGSRTWWEILQENWITAKKILFWELN